MVISTDVSLRGTDWNIAISSLESIFKTRTNFSLFLLCASIGVMYDKQIVTPIENGEDQAYVPRTVLHQHSEDLDFLFQSAILTTTTENLSEEERLFLAFGEEKKSDFDRMKFITRFANFGVTKLNENIGSDVLETMENIKDFLSSTMEGSNFEIDSLSDDEINIAASDLIP